MADGRAVYRSDFFPGLGWLLTREIWAEVAGPRGDRWPAAYWDEWMRSNKQRRQRACVRPEVSRTYTYGEAGTSQGQFFPGNLGP